MRTKTFSTLMLGLGLFAFTASALRAQVGINNTGATPNASAVLDLQTGSNGTMGFLPPQVALTNVTVAAPVTGAATGLIVYSTTAPTGGSGIGYYYWTGTAWTGLGGGGSSLTGSGIDNYVAVWTPNGTTLGTGLIQDNGTSVGINSAPNAGDMLYVTSATQTGIWGVSTTSFEYGVYGEDDNWIGVEGVATGSGEVGVYGIANGTNAVGMIAIADNGNAIEGFTDDTNGLALFADNEAAAGKGLYAYGDTGAAVSGAYDGLHAYSANDQGINSQSVFAGVYAYGNQGYGSWGQDSLGDYAISGLNYYNSYGYGLYAYGVNAGGDFSDPNGDVAVLAYNADEDGIYAAGVANGGYFQDENSSADYAYIADGGSAAGGYFEDGAGDYVYDAYNGQSNEGSGPKNTIVQDETGKYRGMSCTEAPEILFQDYGTSQLVNGKVHIDLDKIYAHTVAINEKHPLRVMVTLNDECNGVFVTNRTATGFDVVELNHGTSNASFTYEVTANRADTKTYKGIVRNYSDVRYADAPGPLARPKQTAKTGKVSASMKTASQHSGTKHVAKPKLKVVKGTASAKAFEKMGKN